MLARKEWAKKANAHAVDEEGAEGPAAASFADLKVFQNFISIESFIGSFMFLVLSLCHPHLVLFSRFEVTALFDAGCAADLRRHIASRACWLLLK